MRPAGDARVPRASAGDPAAGQRAGAGLPRPASIWDLPERGARGPRPRHDHAAIAATATRIADAGGLEAVTMRRVASELGMATMSLYNYVPAKEHLAQLVIDHLAAEYTYASLPARDPRSAIADLARQARDIARRHPWLPGLLHRPLPPGPNGLRYLDYFLGLLASSGLDTGAKLEIIAMISGFATTYGALQGSLASEPTSADDHAAAQVQAFARAAASGTYPNLAAALAAAGPVRSEDAVFESCIQRLIDVARPGTSPALLRHYRQPRVARNHRLGCHSRHGAVLPSRQAEGGVRPVPVPDRCCAAATVRNRLICASVMTCAAAGPRRRRRIAGPHVRFDTPYRPA